MKYVSMMSFRLVIVNCDILVFTQVFISIIYFFFLLLHSTYFSLGYLFDELKNKKKLKLIFNWFFTCIISFFNFLFSLYLCCDSFHIIIVGVYKRWYNFLNFSCFDKFSSKDLTIFIISYPLCFFSNKEVSPVLGITAEELCIYIYIYLYIYYILYIYIYIYDKKTGKVHNYSSKTFH